MLLICIFMMILKTFWYAFVYFLRNVCLTHSPIFKSYDLFLFFCYVVSLRLVEFTDEKYMDIED